MKKNKYTKKQLLDMLALELYRINYGDTILDLTGMLEGENPELADDIYSTVFNDEMKVKKENLIKLIKKVNMEKSGAYGPIMKKNCEETEFYDAVKRREGSE